MLLTQKPCIFAANVGEDDLADQGAGNPYVAIVRKFAEEEGSSVTIVSAQVRHQSIRSVDSSIINRSIPCHEPFHEPFRSIHRSINFSVPFTVPWFLPFHSPFYSPFHSINRSITRYVTFYSRLSRS